MSLLMDALKRAESSKQAAGRKLTVAESEINFSLEPLSSEPASLTGKAQPNHAQHSDHVNADLAAGISGIATSTPPASSAIAFRGDESRAVIRNAFTAKIPAAATRKPLWISLATIGVVAIGIGIYFSLQWSGMGQGTLAADTNQFASAAPPPGPDTLPPPQHAAPTTAIFAPNPALTASNAEAPPRFTSPTDSPTPPIRLTRTSPEPDSVLQRGDSNLQGSSLAEARQDYEKTLESAPNNVDALLGLASIAQREGRAADAERYRQRALDADPRDPAAQAAVLGTSTGNPMDIESRLKNMLAAQPASAPLNFVLGNLYARQARWNEAQQGYFNAVAGDTENPDYLFNLAVSLDQMHQPRLAAQHYQMALDAAERRPAAFQRERVRQRMSQLAP